MSLRVEVPWVFVEILKKMVFWVERDAEEAKQKIWKTATVCPLKIENSLISWVRYSRSTRKATQEMPQKHIASFAGSYISRKSHERVTKLFV